jgi:DnaK suppressor protein
MDTVNPTTCPGNSERASRNKDIGRLARYAIGMDSERARELLSAERSRIERALAVFRTDGPLEGDDRVEPGDEGSEDLYQDEFNADRADDLHAELRAVERAEARLAAGTYGLSVESGEPIPDARLEAVPTAERTIEEQRLYRQA